MAISVRRGVKGGGKYIFADERLDRENSAAGKHGL